MNLSRLAVQRPVATCCLMGAAVLVGLIALTRLPVNLLPPLEIPAVTVWTTWANAPPGLVVREITEPIESTLRNLPGAQRVRSISREGESLVTVELAWSSDLRNTVQIVRERLDAQRFNLPEDSDRPVVLDTDPDNAPMMGLALRSGSGEDGPSLATLQQMGERILRPRLEQTPGVARARVIGGAGPEVRITIDPTRLSAYDLTLDAVHAMLAAYNQDKPAGLLRRGNYRYALRIDGAFRSLEDMREAVLIREPGAAPIRLRDVAEVEMGERERLGAVLFDGMPAVGVLIQKTADANLLTTSDDVNRVIVGFDAEYPDIALTSAFDQADFVRRSIRGALTALAGGGVLAFLALLLWFRNVRYAIPVAIAMPVAVIASFFVFDTLDVGLNVMSIGGLALGVGMLVDNAIISVENIARHRETGLDANSAAGRGATEVALPMAASTLTTVSVFLPMALTPGVAGQLFRDQALAVTVTLLLAWVVALTLLPTLVARWTRRDATRVSSRSSRFHDMYRRAVDAIIDHPIRTSVLLLVFLAAAAHLGRSLPRAFFPKVDEGAFWMELSLSQGSSLEATLESARELSDIARSLPGVRGTLTTAGAAVSSFVPGSAPGAMRLEQAQIQVYLDETATDVQTAMATLRRQIPVHLGTAVEMKPPVTAMSTALIGNQPDVSIKVLTRRSDGRDDQNTSGNVAEVLRSLLSASGLPLADVVLQGVEGRPGYRVVVDERRAAQLGVEPAKIADALRTYMDGRTATMFNRTDERIPIVVRGSQEEQPGLQAILDEPIDTAVGRVPIRTLATVEPVEVAGELYRVDQTPVAIVNADIDSDDLIGVSDRIRGLLADAGWTSNRADGLEVDIGGAQSTLRTAYRSMLISLAFSILIVLLILAAQFESLRLPWIIIAVVPLALAGAVVVLSLWGASVNVITWIGAIVLVGIVVNDAILKVDFIVRAEREGLSRREAIHEAGRRRLRPILMTTVTTVCGVAPLAAGFGAGGELGAPLARTLIGGLIIGSALTLFVVPLAYRLLAGPVRAANEN